MDGVAAPTTETPPTPPVAEQPTAPPPPSPPPPAAAAPAATRGNGPLRWLQAPWWVIALFTGYKSFADNPILGSRRLNRLGLHVWRLKAAHALAGWRRARIGRRVPAELREQFDRDGFVVIPDFLPAEDFAALRDTIMESGFDCREQQQGDTLTRRWPVGPELLRAIPRLDALLDNPVWRGVLAYVASSRAAPLHYIQAIAGGVAEGPPDPQLQLHSDTFHPSLKAWLFLTDVAEDGRPLTYVPGSHRLTPERIAWEKRRSERILDEGDRLSQRGSLRIAPEELPELGLPPPRRFCVPANTLVAVDTCGFHARADSGRPTLRVEIWAYCRRSPFLPWTGLDPLSFKPLAIRRAQWLGQIVDWMDRKGLIKQHWRAVGPRRPMEF